MGLITKTVKIIVANQQIKRYRELGYNFKKGETIEIPIHLLTKGSGVEVEAKCVVCEEKHFTSYCNYIKCIENNSFSDYCCQKCAAQIHCRDNNPMHNKDSVQKGLTTRKKTVLKEFGVEYIFQTEEFKIKRKETCLEKYSVEFASQDPEVKQKIKDNTMKKHGVTHTSKLPEVKQKRLDTNLRVHGFEHTLQVPEFLQKKKDTTEKIYGDKDVMKLPEFIEKRKNTNLKKYNKESVFQVEEVKQKIKNTNLERCGFEYYMQSLEFKVKVKNTLLEKYNVTHVSYIPGVAEKSRKTKEKNGTIMSLEIKTLWEAYRIVCNRLTKRLKNDLFRNWNGKDFYDDEYIKNNSKLNCYDVSYPTIDHKTSKLEGFLTGLSPEEICKFDNLCITKRGLNSKKNKKNEKEFRIILDEIKDGQGL